ncbi:protein kinase subdomain-containing protein [Nannizzia gypsea CBS 118893]|uniref:Protein kinase subdomain-containing protein n=1 Tax=Arthroderma gypseum (strain ATCC MYA-4604 / CBS 118893) TaxID=535722 RepID=E4V2B5_ARTGP|nr:protein kinase subdomain-containing protein [Nannizzia gypsea CBS 118893]EFR04180.1 protein kinase subdomain-containing protein [Nannizzia gypsea CBS 118893]
MKPVDTTKEDPTPCPTCGWSDLRRSRCSHTSQVKLVNAVSNRAWWNVGSDMILKEDPHDKWQTSEVANLEFVQENTTIPVPTIAKDWVQSDNRHFLLMERIPGETMDKLYHKLSTEEMEGIAEQVAEFIQQLRPLQSPEICGIGGTPLHNGWVFLNNMEPAGPFSSDEELWDFMKDGLARLPTKAVDLDPENIVIKDGKVTGILDWEFSGYYPVWWQYVAAGKGSPEEVKWLEIMERKIKDPYPEARQWHKDLRHLSFYLDLTEDGKKTLERLMADGE